MYLGSGSMYIGSMYLGSMYLGSMYLGSMYLGSGSNAHCCGIFNVCIKDCVQYCKTSVVYLAAV